MEQSTEVVSRTSPPDWFRDIDDAIRNPELYRYVEDERDGQTVVPLRAKDNFDKFHTRAMAHCQTKAEHEALAHLNFYVVWKYELFRAGGHRYWQDYIHEATNSPFMIQQSSVDHWNATLDSLFARGATAEQAVRGIEIAKTAVARLAKVPDESLPPGGMSEALETIAEVGSSEGNRVVSDMLQETRIVAISSVFDEKESRLYFELRVVPFGEEGYKHDYMIQGIEQTEAEWITNRLGVQKGRRAIKRAPHTDSR